MTALEFATLRQLAVQVLRHRAGPEADAATLGAAARFLYDELASVLTPLIGVAGVEALTARAVHVTQRDFPWLASTSEPGHTQPPFTQVIFSLEQQDPALVAEAAAAVLATFMGLLIALIGEPLTTRLMHQAWPDGFPDTGKEGTART